MEDFVLSYFVAGIVFAFAADGVEPSPVHKRIAIILFWLPLCIMLGILARMGRFPYGKRGN